MGMWALGQAQGSGIRASAQRDGPQFHAAQIVPARGDGNIRAGPWRARTRLTEYPRVVIPGLTFIAVPSH